jgi:hypothetical protein
MSTEGIDTMYEALQSDAPYTHGDLYGYHSVAAIWDTSPRAMYRFGIEAEKEDLAGKHLCQLYQGCREEYLPYSWRAERDGSLGMHGFELISPIYNLSNDVYKTHLGEPVLNYLIHSETSYACGGHITVSKYNADADWYNKKAAQIIPLLYALYPKRAKRRGYSKFYTKNDYNERYNAINLGSSDRMEIRIFSAIKSLKQLEWRVTLLRILFTTEKYEDLSWDTIYKDLLDINSKLGSHIYRLYEKKYGEKVLLAAAYSKAFAVESIEWKSYSKVRTLIPTGVRNRLIVQPNPTVKSNLKQLTLDVCDYSQETNREA